MRDVQWRDVYVPFNLENIRERNVKQSNTNKMMNEKLNNKTYIYIYNVILFFLIKS